ncbi:MAG: hypothetical protein CR967_04965 [Proteobacteria bacterium]|nr:MAG: hypothetical protein CR967_04965 [Pseudomonadota bacterium]
MKAFSLYMKDWLYGENGYYAKMPDIGKKGDFYTSVSTSMFFGGSIAKHLLERIDGGFLSKNVAIVEIGAHRGYLLADMVQFIFTLRPKLLESLKFVVVEPLDAIRAAQKEYFKSCFGDGLEVDIVKDLSLIKVNEAYVVSNELFDAFPCELIYEDKMLYIDSQRAVFGDLSSQARDLAKRYKIKKGEIALGLEKLAKDLGESFGRYEFIGFDYGQMDHRNDMSLRIYKNHHSYPFFELTTHGGNGDKFSDFFANSDITYDVHFSQVKDAFEQNGAKMQRFCTQMVALSEFGITDLLEILHKNVDDKTYKIELEKAKQLILPNFLGERFKMIKFIKA